MSDNLTDNGSAEFWVKFANDVTATSGTDEVLLTITTDDMEFHDPPRAAPLSSKKYDTRLNERGPYSVLSAITGYAIPGNLKVGATIKIERFGTEIRATWFFWGTGADVVSDSVGGAVSAYQVTLMENSGNASGWLGGEWHHIKIDWNVTPQDWKLAKEGNPPAAAPNQDKIRLYLDNVAQNNHISALALEEGTKWLTLDEIFLDDLEAGDLGNEFVLEDNGDITENVLDADGAVISSSTLMVEDFGNPDYIDRLDQIVNGVGDGDANDGESIFKGATKKNVKFHLGKIASVPSEQGIHIGGFLLQTGDETMSVYKTGTLPAKIPLYRLPNATFDDVFVFDEPAGADSATGKFRDQRYAKNTGGATVFQLNLPVPASDTANRFEIACVTATFEQPAGTTVRAGVNSGASPPPVPLANPLWTNVSVGDTLDVSLEGNGTVSPVLENITGYVLHPPEVLEDDETAGD